MQWSMSNQVSLSCTFCSAAFFFASVFAAFSDFSFVFAAMTLYGKK